MAPSGFSLFCFLLFSRSSKSDSVMSTGGLLPTPQHTYPHRQLLSWNSNVDFSSSRKSHMNRGDRPLWWRDVLLDEKPNPHPPHLSEAADRRHAPPERGREKSTCNLPNDSPPQFKPNPPIQQRCCQRGRRPHGPLRFAHRFPSSKGKGTGGDGEF